MGEPPDTLDPCAGDAPSQRDAHVARRARATPAGAPPKAPATALALVLLLALAVACAGCVAQPRTRGPAPTPTSTPAPAPSPLPVLTPEQLAGQRTVYGYSGLTPPDELLDLVRHGEAAGVIFFGDNIASESQLREVVLGLERASAASTNPVRAPLLLMIDQEGGQIRRLPGAPALSEKRIGASPSPEAEATKAGREAGLNLRGVGLNVNLAPVLDVYRAEGDFVDRYGRSYSSDPDSVSELGGAFISALQGEGVAATAKHYPGLGSATATQNTDARPVTLPLSEATLSDVDETPFRSAIAGGVKLIMVSWAIYPALDASAPAGLSQAVVEQRLRATLGFRGVIVSDSIQAGALKPYGGIATCARRAAEAGVDLILCGKAKTGISTGLKARDALARGYRNGTLDKALFEESVQRVIALRQSLDD